MFLQRSDEDEYEDDKDEVMGKGKGKGICHDKLVFRIHLIPGFGLYLFHKLGSMKSWKIHINDLNYIKSTKIIRILYFFKDIYLLFN